MYFYPYHAITKELLDYEPGSNLADKSPLENNVWHHPGNSTLIKPPKQEDHKVAVFDIDKQVWNMLSDYRNTTVYSKDNLTSVKILDIGVHPEAIGGTLDKPPSDSHKYEKNRWVLDEDKLKENLDNLKTKIIKIVDQQSDYFYIQLVGNRQSEYAEAFSQAKAYLDNTKKSQPMIMQYSDIMEISEVESAEIIIDKAQTLLDLQLIVRQQRLSTKKKIKKAATAEEVNQIFELFNNKK